MAGPISEIAWPRGSRKDAAGRALVEQEFAEQTRASKVSRADYRRNRCGHKAIPGTDFTGGQTPPVTELE